MKINKLDDELFISLESSLKEYILAWHKIPTDIDVEQIQIDRIRYVKEWGTRTEPEDGFILEFGTASDHHRELLARSELNLKKEQFKTLLEEHNQNGLQFGKDFVTNTEWYEHPVVWGTLDDLFDEAEYYEHGGKYEGADYLAFEKKYD